MGSETDLTDHDLHCFLWIARVGALIIVVFSLLWALGYALSPRGVDPNAMEMFELALFPFGMCAGYLIALRCPVFGGTLSLACLAVFLGARQEINYVMLFGPLAVPGVFFVFYGIYRRDQKQVLDPG